MSNWDDSKGSIPPRWLHCPRKARKLIQNKFLAFKTPLSSAFDSQVPEECRFTIDMLFSSLRSEKLKLGLWIDLTNTTRFYDKKSLETYGCKYLKLQCRGHGETPSEEQTRTFVQVCKNFIAHNPLEIIGVHCTHGFNRTGFLIVSYLVENDGTSVDAGLVEFANTRPPGIYKADYIQELFRRYDDVDDAPDPPPRPAWYLEYDDSNVEDRGEGPSSENDYSQDLSNKRRKREFNNKNPVFMAGVPGVTPILDERKLSGIQRRVQEICSWNSSGFPGSQPVSMDEDNIRLLHEKPYRVSWKADGTRYMMLIQSDGDIYFIDRDNSVFEVKGMTFPHPEDISRTIKDTLLDGEMVIDKANGKDYPRYLVYDVIMYDGEDVSQLPFHSKRYAIIERSIIHGRHKAIAQDRTVLIWCTKELAVKEKRSLRINIEFDHATLIRWSPDGKAFIIHKSVSNSMEVYKISKKPDGTLASATKALEFPKIHTDDVVGMDIECAGKYIITCSKTNDLVIWDLKGQILATLELYLGSTYRARISPCGRFVAASGFTPDTNVWEVVFTKSGQFKQVTKAFNLPGHTSGILDFTFSADSSRMATVSKDGTYRFYNTKIEFEKGEDPHVLLTGTWDNSATANIAISPNTEVLAIAHGSSLSLYSTITGELDATIEDIFMGSITCLTFDAAGEYVLVAGDKHVKVFRNVTGYRTAIESAKRKLMQKQTSATKERLEKLIADNTKFLEEMEEKCP